MACVPRCHSRRSSRAPRGLAIPARARAGRRIRGTACDFRARVASDNLDGSHSSLAPKSYGQVALDLTIYYTANVALVATYVALVFLALRRRIRGFGRFAVLAAPVLLQIALLVPRPWLSTDVLSYIAQGFVGIAAGFGNAYVNVPRDVLGTAVGDQLTAIGWRPQTISRPTGRCGRWSKRP